MTFWVEEENLENNGQYPSQVLLLASSREELEEKKANKRLCRPVIQISDIEMGGDSDAPVSQKQVSKQTNKKARRNEEDAKRSAYESILKEHMKSSSQKNEAARAVQGVSFVDYVEVDTCASVCGALTDEDITARVAGGQPVAEEPEGEEDEDDEVPVRPSASEVMEALNVARLFFSFEEGEEDSLRRVRALEQRAAAVAFREKKLMVITDFFGQ
ncbi:hypothetical protein MTO96_044391 [Rhipicephalus appendiculatus]